MLIKLNELCIKYGLNITGVIHVGAHECEEAKFYMQEGISKQNTFWVEAMENKVSMMKKKDPSINIYQAVIDKEDDKTVEFNVANNGQSSSTLEFGTHSKHHPSVRMINKITLKTKRLDTLINENQIPIEKLNFANFDIQGKELDALKSMGDYIKHLDYIYTEINTEYVYKDCPLLSDLDHFLSEFGFKRVECKIYRNCGWGDAFYIKA